MKITGTIPPLLCVLLLSGCAGSQRLLTGTIGGGLGALAGHSLGDRKPVATAIGAGAGVLASEALQFVADHKTRDAFNAGFDKGRSDTAKNQYWIMVNHQKSAIGDGTGEAFSVHEINLPERFEDGSWRTPSRRQLRFDE
jgi:hypothetical protein